MSDYKQYITSVNKIFEYLARMKAGWNNLDNHNYVNSIEEYKEVVTSNVYLFKNSKKTTPLPNKIENLEVLGDD